MRRIAVIGATGTAGSRVVAKLQTRDVTVVQIARSHGIDLISGEGLGEALDGVDVAIDASNAFPPDETLTLQEALTTATLNVIDECTKRRVGHLVLLSIFGIQDPVFDYFPYYAAKRAQEDIVTTSAVPHTLVSSTQWHEFATNPAAVTFHDDEVVVQDWLIQPIAADSVADVLVQAALGAPTGSPRIITGPEQIRLPELTAKLLSRRGECRPVRTASPEPAALGQGVLLAPQRAEILGPTIGGWLETIDDGA